MASSTLEIKIKALVDGLAQIQSLAATLNDAAKSAADAGKAASDGSNNLGDLADASDDAAKGAGGLADSLKPAEEGIKGLSGHVKSLVAGFIALVGVMTLKQAADVAARAETLGVTLGVVAKNAGYSADQIERYEKELEALGITAAASRESLTQLIQAGVNLNDINDEGASKAAQLARASQDLAVVTGENSSETLQRLITNIRQLDSVGLRYMGITVDIAGAQTKFATSIGKTAEGLTQQQKQMAVMNATMEEATKLQGAYESSMDTVGKQLSSMSRYQEEAAKAIGDSLLPAYGEMVKNATKLLKTMEQLSKELNDNSNFAETFGEGIGSASGSITTIVESLLRFAAELAPAFGMLTQSIGDVVGLLGGVASGMTDATRETGILTEILKTAALLVAGLADGMRLIGATVSLISSGWTGVLGIMTHGIASIVQLIDVQLGNSIRKVAYDLDAMSVSSKKSFNQVVSDFENGNTATQRFIASQDEAKRLMAEFGKATTYSAVEEDVRKLTEAQREGTLNAVEAVAAGAKITESIQKLGAASKLTEKEVVSLNKKVANSLDGVQAAYSAAIEELGLGIEELNGESLFRTVSEEAAKLGGALISLGENGLTTGDQFSQAFSRGLQSAKTISDLEEISQALQAARNSALDVSRSANEAQGMFFDLFSADLKSAKTEADLKALEDRLIGLADQGVITSTTLQESIAKIDEASEKLEKTFANVELLAPLETLGLTLDGLTTGLTAAGEQGAEAIGRIISALAEAGATASLTQSQLFDVFNKGVGGAKTLADLGLISTELARAKESGVLFGQAYKDAIGGAATKFQELLQAQLKSANTKTEFDALVLSVKKMGDEGVISGKQLSDALLDINKKAQQTKQSLVDLATQSANMAEQNLAAVRASADVSSAGANLEAQKLKLLELTVKSQKEKTKESQGELRLQQALTKEASAAYAVAQAKYRYELAQLDALIAKHRQLAAEKLLSNDPTDESAQALVRTAEAESEQRQIAVEKTREGVAAQEALAVSAAKAVVQAKAFAEQMGVATGGAKESAGALGTVKNQASLVGKSIATWDLKSVTAQLTQGGIELGKAEVYAKRMMGSMKAVAAFGSEGIKNYQGITKSIQKAVDAENRMKAAAQATLDNFSATAEVAQAIGDGVYSANQAAVLFSRSGNAMEQALKDVQKQALQVVSSSRQAADGFLSSAASINDELLNATGREAEASQIRFETRKKELDLEYQMLKVKIQSAAVVARAAGLSTSDLNQQLAEASQAYNTASSNLSELQSLEASNREKNRLEEERTRLEREDSQKQEVEGVKEVAAERAKLNAKESEEQDKQAKKMGLNDSVLKRRLDSLKSSSALPSFTDQIGGSLPTKQAAGSLQSIAKAGGTQTIKVVEHKFSDGKGNSVTASIQEDQSERFISMLEDFRRRS